MPLARVPGLRRLPGAASRIHRDVVLFTSWKGRYCDSPRAISEQLWRQDAPLEHVWVLHPGTRPAPHWATAVRPGSAAHLAAHGRAACLVSNNSMPGFIRKKRGSLYLQTWHGTPLKRIAFDIERPAFGRSERYLRDLRRDIAGWDYLVSPNAFSTRVLRAAFRYEGRVIETGYPRNDLLATPDRDRIGAAVRAALGIPDGARAVLYAPTWRDDAAFSLELDLARLAGDLPDHVFLLRAHQMVAATVPPLRHPRVRDVSGHDEVGELLLAADVLITDYSSLMFDFAVTGKPLLFFTYDLARYRDSTRGFYFDFEAEAPGPLLADTADVAAALHDLDAVREHHAGAYERFRRRFCHLDDGGATQRVIDTVFRW